MRARSSWALALLPLLASCSFGDDPPVTEGDRASGAEMHQQLLTEFGGAYEGEEAAYLKALGGKIAAAAGLDGQCQLTLVNTDVVNAFAVPGCYIYVTRGLMSIVNSEAELSAVLAHEVGHIVGRHSQRQQRRSLWRSLGVLAVSVLTGSERLTQIAGAAAGLFTLRYSRKQEFEADDHGVRFLTAAGHDPYAAADMLQTLGRHEAYLSTVRGRDANSVPEWARTHPLSGNRAERARAAAAATGIGDGRIPEHEVRYLGTIDGLLYGDDPAQGFVIGRAFAHPVMRIAFEAPPGFTLTNSPKAILIEGPDGMRGEFAGGTMPEGGAAAYTEAVLGQLLGQGRAEVLGSEWTRINGLRALVTRAVVHGGAEPVSLTMVAYEAGASAYHFVMLSSSSVPAGALDPLFGSFRQISEAEARTLRPRVIDTVRVQPGQELRTLAARMAGDNRLAHFLMLNGRDAGQPLRPGEPVKLVVYGSP